MKSTSNPCNFTDLEEPYVQVVLSCNQVSDLSDFNESVEALLRSHRFSHENFMQIQIALEEVVDNIVKYAHRNILESHHIFLRFWMEGNMANFQVVDDGIPFDPTQQELVDVNAFLEDRPIGGLGIHIVRQVMNDILYCREDNKNVLTMKKQV